MPLVKAVREVNTKLESEVSALKSEIGKLSTENEELKARMDKIEALLKERG